MNNYHERKFYKHVVMAAVISLVLAIASTVYGLIAVFKNNTIGNNLFEIVYMGVHIIISLLLIILSVEAITKKPFILKNLTYRNELEPNNFYRFGGLVIAVFGLGVMVFSILHVLDIITILSSFPLFLRIDGANAGLNLVIIGMSFFLFPFSYEKDIIVEKIKKHKGEQL